jgi:hypothetical protein
MNSFFLKNNPRTEETYFLRILHGRMRGRGCREQLLVACKTSSGLVLYARVTTLFSGNDPHHLGMPRVHGYPTGPAQRATDASKCLGPGSSLTP